jgi:hypothetical protein
LFIKLKKVAADKLLTVKNGYLEKVHLNGITGSKKGSEIRNANNQG